MALVAVTAVGAVVVGAGFALAINGARETAAGPSVSPTPGQTVAETPISPTMSPMPTVEATATPAPTSTPEPTPPPSASVPIATPTATPQPGPVVDPPTAVLPPNSRVVVTVESLQIRELAHISSYSPILAGVPRGEVLHIKDWNGLSGEGQLLVSPWTTQDGKTWYRVEYVPGVGDWPNDARRGERIHGFAAIEVDGQRRVELLAPRCPDAIDVTTLTAITPWERLACSGDRELTLEGTYGCGTCDPYRRAIFAEPKWFVSDQIPPPELLSPVGRVQQPGVGPILLAWAPEAGGAPGAGDRGSIIRVTGHFNDRRSPDCAIVVGQGQSFDVEDVSAEFYCRELFVVSSWEIIGRDDAYPSAP
jgi:hypothetical protein